MGAAVLVAGGSIRRLMCGVWPVASQSSSGGKTNPNISLLCLQPYSPELNPVEGIWAYLRGNQLSNRVYDSYDAIVDACRSAWNALATDIGRIASIAIRDWASVRN